MSWGYWGIITGVLIMVTLFFFCVDLLCRSEEAPDTRRLSDQDSASEIGSKHAA